MASPLFALTPLHPPPHRQVLIPAPKVGDVMNLPEEDAFGAKIPTGPVLLVTLPPCDSCSARFVPAETLSTHHRLPIILVTQDDPEDTLAKQSIAKTRGLFVFHDPDGRCVGAGMIFYSPRAVRLDRQGRVTNTDLESDSIREFIDGVDHE